MGEIVGYKHGEGSVSRVDPRLWDIVQNAISAVPYNAQIRSGSERGPGDKGNHSKGYAVDVTLIDPRTGKVIPDTGRYGGVAAAKIYEQYAQAARVYQTSKYPELNNVFRWGGGFRGGGTPFDLMHLDITPKAKGAMAYYSWDTGFNKLAESAMPGIRKQTSRGLGGVEGARLVSQYQQALAGSGNLIPPAAMASDAPIPATRTSTIDQKRAEFAQQAGGNGRGGFDSPQTAQQVGDLYSGILPPNGRDPTGRGATLAELLSFNPERTRVASIDPTVGMPRLPAPIAATPNLNIPDGSNLPRSDVSYSSGLGAFMTPEAREEAITRMASLGQTSVQPIGFDMLDLAMRDARSLPPLPRLPAPVRVPTGANADPVGNGATEADFHKTTGVYLDPFVRWADEQFGHPTGVPYFIETPAGARRDPVGSGASFADLSRFNGSTRGGSSPQVTGSAARDPVGSGARLADLAAFNARARSQQSTTTVGSSGRSDPVGNGATLADLLRFNPSSVAPAQGGGYQTRDPIGSGASLADLGRFIRPGAAAPPASSSSSSTVGSSGRYDPVGSGASFSDLKNFTSPIRTSGIAGTVQLPRNVTPQVPQIAPPAAAPKPTTKTITETIMVRNPAYIPPKGSVVTPTGGVVTQSQMDAIRAVPANSYMKPITPAPAPNVPEFIPKQVTRTITVPAPAAKQVAPAPAPVAPTPMPYGAGAASRANAVNLVQGTNGYFYVANPDGTYTGLRTQDEALARQRATASRPGTAPMLAPRGLPPLPMPYGSRPGLPTLPGMVPGAVGIPRAQTLGSTLGDWWSRTLLGRIGNAVTGRPQAPFGGVLGMATGDVRSPFAGFGGSPLATSMGQHSAMLRAAAAAQAQRDPLGAAIGAANRASPSPTYDVSGGNNSFNPQSVQNSSRWQTGY